MKSVCIGGLIALLSKVLKLVGFCFRPFGLLRQLNVILCNIAISREVMNEVDGL